MPSPNSSVGSKSSKGTRKLNFRLPNAGNCFPDEESTKPLHSSWIKRLRLGPLANSAAPPHSHAPALVEPPPPPSVPDHRNTISTGESRTRASISGIGSAFFRRLLNFCRERHGDDGGGHDVSRPFVGFGPFRLRTQTGLLLQASPAAPTSATPPLPWVRLPAVDTDGLDQDPGLNSDGIGSFGFIRKDSVGVLGKPSCPNYWNLRKEEEREGRKIGFRSGIVHNWIHGNINFADLGAGSMSFKQKRASEAVDDHHGDDRLPRSSQFSLPLLSHQENLSRSRANSFVRSTGDEFPIGELVGESANRFMDFENPCPSGNGSRCSTLPRLPLFGLDQSAFERHFSGDPRNGAVGDMNGAKYISRASRVGRGGDLDPHLIHHNAVPRKHDRQVSGCPSEPDEAFSYWNMGRYKRAKTTSSAFPAFTMNRNRDA